MKSYILKILKIQIRKFLYIIEEKILTLKIIAQKSQNNVASINLE